MIKKPNYCKGVVIVHGKCELLLVEHIKSNLHLPIKIFSESNGANSIQIDGLMKVLGNNIFKNKELFSKEYIVEEQKGKLVKFSLMIIMDLDDTDDKKKQQYISGEMFKNHWLSPYIIPIWNKENLDEVLLDIGLIKKIPNKREKGKVYRNIFPKNNTESDIEQVQELMRKFEKTSKSNMNILIKNFLNSL